MAPDDQTRPACTVIVPAYNCVTTLETTLRSAFAQSVQNIEIIVVDDGSTDGTRDVLRRLAAQDGRLRCLFQINQGVSAARNAGVLIARAPVIACLDADDLWPPDHLAVHLDRLRLQPHLGVSFSAAEFIDATGIVTGSARPQLSRLALHNFLRSNPTTTCSTWVVRREVFRGVGLFDTTLRRCEDQEWLVRAALAGVFIEGTRQSIVSYRTVATGLASDLAGMRAGYVAMLNSLARRAPELVNRERNAALSTEDQYLARQALRLNLPRRVARGYIVAALRRSPELFWQSPRSYLGTLLTACVPALIPVDLGAGVQRLTDAVRIATLTKTPRAP